MDTSEVVDPPTGQRTSQDEQETRLPQEKLPAIGLATPAWDSQSTASSWINMNGLDWDSLTAFVGSKSQPVAQANLGNDSGHHSVDNANEGAHQHRIAQQTYLNLGIMSSLGESQSAAHSPASRELGKRQRSSFQSSSIICSVEGCGADLSESKDYHQRHKVCEGHARASTVLHKGQIMRFCQQCSRFHLLSEFDEGKRSCRRRLLGHNKRRRKKEERAREPEEAPGLRSPPAASGASPLEYDAQEDIRRRLTASLLPDPPDLERAPSLQLGQSLSLSPYSQQSPAPGEGRSSLALSPFLQAQQRGAPEASLSSLFLGNQSQTADLLGRSLGLTANQQLLLNFQHHHQQQLEQGAKTEGTESPLQLQFMGGPSSLLQGAGVRHSPALQQLFAEKTTALSPGRMAVSETSSLFPLPSALQPLATESLPPVQATPLWTARSLDGLAGAARATDSAGGLPRTYLPSDRTGRISFKLFDKNPNDLPQDLRDQILDWLQRRPSAMEMYLRPGCVHVSAYLAMPEEHWQALESDLELHLATLIAGPSSRLWSGGSFYAFVGEQVAWVEKGAVRQVFPRAQSSGTPVIHSVQPRWRVAGQPVDVTITGQGLLHPDNRILCLHQGLRFLDSRLRPPLSDATDGGISAERLCRSFDLVQEQDFSGNGAASEVAPASRGLEWSPMVGGNEESQTVWSKDPHTGVETLRVTMPGPTVGSTGVMYVELDRSGFPSNMKPILVADAPVCAELATLEGERESVGPPGCAARKQAEAAIDAFVHDLGWVLGCQETGEGRGKLSDPLLCSRLLAFTMEHGWLHTTGRILDAMAAARKGQMGNGHVAKGEERLSGQPGLAAQDLGVGRIRKGAIDNKEVVFPEAKEEEPERGLGTNNEGGATEVLTATPQSDEPQSQQQSPGPRSSGLSDTPLGLLRSTGLGQQPGGVNLLTWHDSKSATTTNFGVSHLGVQEQEPLRTTPALCAAVTSAEKFSLPGDHSPGRLTLPQQASHGAMQQNGSGHRSSGLSDEILLWAVGTFGDIKTSANLHATWASEKLQGALLDCTPGPAWDASGSEACRWSFHQAGCSAHGVLSGKDTKAKPFLVPSC